MLTLSVTQDFGRLLRTLRDTRSLTQLQLADRAGISESLVRTAERSGTCDMRRSNRLALLRALHESMPLTDREQREFVQAADLGDMAASIGERVRNVITEETRTTIRAAMRAPVVRQTQAWRAFTQQLTKDERAAFDAFLTLMDTTSPAVMLNMLAALQSFQQQTAAASEEDRAMMVVYPPVTKDGHSVQVFAPVKKADNPASKSTRRARG